MEMGGKTALVTGGASGIGRACAILFAKHGANVVIADITEEACIDTTELLMQENVKATYCVLTDVSKPEACREMVELAMGQFGRLDYAVNNAGIGGEANLTADYSTEGWRKVLGINLDGVFYCVKYEIPALLNSGGGAIVNMASILGAVGYETAPAYVAAKHGVVGLTKTAALEYGSKGIRINAVGPGFIETPMIAGLTDQKEAEQMLISRHPIGRLGKAEEVAELVVWLCSKKASFITGSYFPVDGGYLAK
jgi:NAD(P)-dependent dehydrogenase (short-subunit alcohol dehydrogenase family)